MSATTPCAPVVLFIFNRPEQTSRVARMVRAASPGEVYVVADGPRSGRPEDDRLCREARTVIDEELQGLVVSRLYRDSNLGCKRSVSTGLDWVFEKTAAAIILEDDCLPLPSFFPFATELLERHRNDAGIAQICGSNCLKGQVLGGRDSYYYSAFPFIWGWATWARSWKHFDGEMKSWQQVRGSDWLGRRFPDTVHRHYWKTLFDDASDPQPGGFDSWAIPWTYNVWRKNMVSIVPAANLISNEGMESGTHSGKGHGNTTPAQDVIFPLVHPVEKGIHSEADRFLMDEFYLAGSFPERLFWKLRLPVRLSTARRLVRRLRSLGRR